MCENIRGEMCEGRNVALDLRGGETWDNRFFADLHACLSAFFADLVLTEWAKLSGNGVHSVFLIRSP